MTGRSEATLEGVLLSGVGGFYTVLAGGERYVLRAQAKLRRQREVPLVGDVVSFQPGAGEQHGWLTGIAPRRNRLARPPVANIDRLLLVVAAARPQPDLLLVDRMLLSTARQRVRAALVVNKRDEDEGSARAIARQYAGAGIDAYAVCARTGEGLEALLSDMAGLVFALGGQSGVGKSTLINRLYGLRLEVGELSEKVERGRHTTRHCELIPVAGGGMVLDTPGFSLLELECLPPETLREFMPEFAAYEGECQFYPCTHVHEPGCAVARAAAAGEIDPARLDRYRTLYEEMNQRWLERYD